MVTSSIVCRHCDHESPTLNDHLDHLQAEHPEYYRDNYE